MGINLDLYKIFHTVASVNNISNASKRLFISQSAVSQSIKKLEMNIGMPLFIRTSKGVELTKEGEYLFRRVDFALNEIKIAENRFEDIKNLKDGILRIGASDTICKNYLLKHLYEFKKLFPGIKMQVTNRPSYETINLVRNDIVDIGFVNSPIEVPSEYFDIVNITSIEDCFIYSAEYFPVKNKNINIKTLINYPLLLLENISSSRVYINEHFLKHGVKLDSDIELGCHDLIFDFVKLGFGIGSVIKEFVEEELENNKNIKIIDLNHPIPKRHLAMISYNNNNKSFVARKFSEFMKNRADI